MVKAKLDKEVTAAVKFVSGAVPASNYFPELTHFKIANGTITATSALMTMCAPIPLDVEARPHAKSFQEALKHCKSVITMSVTNNQRLLVRSNKFRAYIDCIDDVETPYFGVPVGDAYAVEPQQSEVFLAALEVASRFMDEDSSRECAAGVKMYGGTMMATDSRVAVQVYHGLDLPVDKLLPAESVRQLLSAKEPIRVIQIHEHSVTFWFGDNKWLRTQVLNVDFPDVNAMLNNFFAANPEMQMLPKGIFEAIRTVRSVLEEERVYLYHDCVKSDMANEKGSVYSIGLPIAEDSVQCYNGVLFLKLEGVAERLALQDYPQPCVFDNGGNIRGAIIGINI